jgi:hypothetical protein
MKPNRYNTDPIYQLVTVVKSGSTMKSCFRADGKLEMDLQNMFNQAVTDE